MLAIEPNDPTISTIIIEKIKTTNVLIAVATSESVFLTPHFTKTEVTPANTAERLAVRIHIILYPSRLRRSFIGLSGLRFFCNGLKQTHVYYYILAYRKNQGYKNQKKFFFLPRLPREIAFARQERKGDCEASQKPRNDVIEYPTAASARSARGREIAAAFVLRGDMRSV